MEADFFKSQKNLQLGFLLSTLNFRNILNITVEIYLHFNVYFRLKSSYLSAYR